MTITVMLRVDGLTAPRLREFLQVYWLAWERFRFMPVQRSPGWWWEQDPVFDLKHHLDVVLDRFSPDELQDWVSARLNQPLPLYRPRWKFWLAPNAEGGAALILRLHHCYADGLSLLGIFDRLCPPSPQQHPALYGAAETPQLARWSTAAKAWLERLVANETATRGEVGVTDAEAPATDRMQQAGRSLERVAANGLKLLNEISEFLVEPADTPSDLKRPLLGRRQCRWSEPVPLARFRSVADATSVTINDVLLSCVAAAVRSRLGIEAAELDDAVLHAAVPVDIRSRLPADLQPESGSLGNYFGTVFVPLPVDGESPLERLYRIKHETRRLKKSWQP
ncbi:MAG: wax ester/triacylglycerol synthase domain-containing protein, partial [Marinobacter alexandrii]